MARREPLLPNAGVVARREYRDKTRSRLFIGSTLVLMLLGFMVSLAPIAIRYLDRQSLSRIAVVSADDTLAAKSIAVADSLLNVPPAGADPNVWEKAFVLERALDIREAQDRLAAAELDGILTVERLPSGQLDVVYGTNGQADSVRSQLVGFAAIAIGILDWTATLPPDSQLQAFQTPRFQVQSINVPMSNGVPIAQQELASRSFLGIVFVVLIFITVIIYGMWVATGVAAEKSSRVMELMISAASPRQLLTGKVVGIGLAGLTQYAAIAIPVVLTMLFQDRIAKVVLGPDWFDVPLAGMTPSLLIAYGVFFLLGFTLFALIYASMGAFVSRPDDLQTLSLPLSLIAMVGYLAAIMALGSGGSGGFIRLLSFIPPFSPFVMLARVMVGNVAEWELALSIGILLVTIVAVAGIAVRLYAAGVLLYGQRPGVRAYLAAARKA
jgi:ABC-2 type transport system permease protein